MTSLFILKLKSDSTFQIIEKIELWDEREITMKYNLLDHKRMWVEKLEEDLEQLELLG